MGAPVGARLRTVLHLPAHSNLRPLRDKMGRDIYCHPLLHTGDSGTINAEFYWKECP